jgi:CHAT domain-containing protein/predicted negative regulator of RcsB-dependent stress response
MLNIAMAEEDPGLIMNAGMIYYKDGKLDKALDEYNRALTIYKNKKDNDGTGKCYLKIGDVYFSSGFYQDALSSYNNAFNIFKTLSDIKLQGEALISKGKVYQTIASYEESQKAFDDATALYDTIDDNKLKGLSREASGDLYYDLFMYEDALKYHKDAFDYLKKSDDTRLKTILLCKIGEDYYVSGQNDTGLKKLQEALDVARNDNSISYDILMRTGNIFRKYHDDPNYALTSYEGAREISEKLGDKNKENAALLKKGNIWELKGNGQNARGNYEHIIELSKEVGDRGRQFEALFYMAESYHNDNSDEKSIQAYKECLDFYESVGDRWGKIQTHEKLGEIYEKNNQLDRAEEHYTIAINELEKIRGELKTDKIKESFSEKVMPIYKKMIDFLLKIKKDKDAFYYLELSRARALLDAISRANVDIRKGASEELLKKDKILQIRINDLQTKITRESSYKEKNEKLINELKEEFARSLEEYDVVIQELNEASPAYASLTGIRKPLTVNDVQKKVLKDKETIVEYFINGSKVNVWIISKNTFSVMELKMSSEEIKKRIEDFRKPFEDLKKNRNKFLEILNGFDLENLNILYDGLLKPVIEKAGLEKNTKIIIIPDGILYYLPFETLVTVKSNATDYKDIIFSRFQYSRFLIQDYNIVYAPSASCLDSDIIGGKRFPSDEFLGFGNPNFGKPGSIDTGKPDMTKAYLRLQAGSEYNLSPLPDTEYQIKTVADFFRKSGKTEHTYLRKDATEDNIKANYSKYKYIMIATHGLLNENNPMLSSLAFTRDGSEDGFLKAMEILNLRFNANVVALSACETGLGKIKSGEGVIGLTRAFMYAGVPTVSVSLWSVESSSTSELMKLFYENLVSGMKKGEALRKAKLDIMKNTGVITGEKVSFSHPFFWAPFILMGESN